MHPLASPLAQCFLLMKCKLVATLKSQPGVHGSCALRYVDKQRMIAFYLAYI